MQDQLYEYIKNLNGDEKMEYFSKNQVSQNISSIRDLLNLIIFIAERVGSEYNRSF